jgi:hypothetical protein
LPRNAVASPTHAAKSSAMCASQCSVNRAGDQRPPARVSAVWPPADMPYTPTLSRETSDCRRASWPTTSIARETSAGRCFQLSGPGVL